MVATSFEDIEEKIAGYVTRLFLDYQTPQLVYHNLEHTQTVVSLAAEIAAHYPLTADEHFILISAAWFHDTGQLSGGQQGHEVRSVEIMKEFLGGHHELDGQIITSIEHCILATRWPQQPLSLTGQILCDADTYHLGTDDFARINELVRQEAMQTGLAADNWNNRAISFLRQHSFHTDYSRQKLNEGKARNLASLLDSD